MINVLDKVIEEKKASIEYEDEMSFSNMQCASYSVSLREIDVYAEPQKSNAIKDNHWLCDKSVQIHVLMMDNIKKYVNDSLHSVDALLYHFYESDKLNYLIEFKCANKSAILKYIKDDSIYEKFKDTALLIENQLEFCGVNEYRDLVGKTHAIVVYAGKNDVASSEKPKVPKAGVAPRDKNGKQKRASSSIKSYGKKDDVLIETFGKNIKDLGFASCNANEFPVPAIPEAKKLKGVGKIRLVSLFTANDFSKIIDDGMFDAWDWGDYV